MVVALGPTGKGILISRSSPKEMFITKSGKDILKTFCGSHPIMDLLIKSILVKVIFVFGVQLQN